MHQLIFGYRPIGRGL